MPITRKMQFAAELAPTSFDEASGTVSFVAYAGAVVDRIDWMTGEAYSMTLAVTPDAIDLTRFDGGAAPFLDNHDANSTECVLGAVLPGTAEIVDGQLRCKVKLSVDPANAGKVADVKAGILRNCSVGFDILEKTVVEPSADNPRKMVTVTKWSPFELSLVPVGADPGAQSFSKAKEGQIMTENQNTVAAPAVDVAALKAEGAKAERERLSAIDTAAKATRAPAALVAKLKDDGVSADAAREQFIAHLASEGDKVQTAPATRIEVGATSSEKLRAGVVNALLHKANPGKAAFALTNEGQRFQGLRTADIARKFLEERGVSTHGLNDAKSLERAFFAHSTSDMPDLLGDAIGKSLIQMYAELPAQYQAFSAQVPFSGLYDYKPIVMSGAGSIADVAEGSDYPEIALTESQETISQVKGGQIIAITMEMLLKDNLDGLSRLPAAQAAAARRRENVKIAALFSPNTNHGATMADGVALFNSAHSNLISSGGGVPTAARLDATELLIANQTILGGSKIGLEGSIILVPRALRNQTEALFSPRYTPTSSTSALSPSQLAMQVATFNYLASDAIWYVFANPAIAPVVVYGYPDNTDPLSLSVEDGFSNDTRKYKVTHWFGCGIADYRGAAMNPGA